MRASTRAVLTTGVTALSLGALAVTVSVPPESMRSIQVARPVNFAADVVPIAPGVPVEPPSDADLNSALALIEQLAPVSDGRVITVKLRSHEQPESATVAPTIPNAGAKADAALVDAGSDDVAGQAEAAEPAPLNAASDIIDGVYSVSRYWANYVSLELGPWLINWIPFGYLISDQIYIWYPDFVLPTVDSFVYDFLDPVVNNPLDLGVWFDGIGDVISTAANGIVTGIGSEINYLVTFGWFPIPLPPLPNFPLPGLGSASAAAPSGAASLTSTEAEKTVADKSIVNSTVEVATEPVDTATTADSPNTVVEDETTPKTTEEDPQAPVEDQPDKVTGSAEQTTDEPATEGADESAVEDTTESPAEASPESGVGTDAADESDTGEQADAAEQSDVADQADAAEQSGADADTSNDVKQDKAPGAGEKSVDNDSDGASAKASASDN
ncbi:hypothetical protein NGTWS1803_37750 [Mycolicibacterium cyprinidarum]|nr:hypothetical protein NGTWS1803_37750 [Mycolicibacterium sp. NGTWS1803]